MNVSTAPWVTRREVAALPRGALLLLCALWLLPGTMGRDPWRPVDVTSFSVMLSMAQGRSSWWLPTLGGVPYDTALLPHWLGALAIQVLGNFIEPVMAVRLVFGCMALLAMAGIWYATFHLARTDAAQPLPMPFGGEAPAVDYARALADAALLAFIATLGLLQLGHETTSELVQLAAASAFIWCVAAAPWRRLTARALLMISLPAMAASSGPFLAMWIGLSGAFICGRSSYPGARHIVPWILGAVGLAALTASALDAWRWRFATAWSWTEALGIVRQWVWFLWPVWPLALWTAWRWRANWANRHVALPATTVVCALVCSVFMGGDDRALMMATPGLAILAAFALPTLKRQGSAALDWFSICFFSAAAVFIWFMYGAMHTGWPAKPAANISKLVPGFVPQFSVVAAVLAFACTVAWGLLVRWRTRRQAHPLWKSLVLPAGGVVLCWVLLMTLWLPLLDYARSYRPVVARIVPHLGLPTSCVAIEGASPALIASLEVFSGHRFDAQPDAAAAPHCSALIRVVRNAKWDFAATASTWRLQATVVRPTDREERIGVYRRVAESP